MEMFRSNRLRALGVSSDRRLPQLPDVPTFKEFGIDANLPGWTGIFAPAKTPQGIVEALYQDLVKAGQVKAFQDQARLSGTEVVMSPPNEFRAYLIQEMAMYRRILPPLGIQLD
jgi:tripartite-type tricarboxylate transporter receptor subunit TctC